MNPRISMITLGVTDLEKSIQFYEQGLGFPKMDSPPEVAFFTLNGTWLGLFGYQDLADDALVSSVGSGFKRFALAHNVASPDEVNAVIEKAKSAGANVTKEPEATSWGGYCGYFEDPDGHLWEIAHNPFFWPGPSDT